MTKTHTLRNEATPLLILTTLLTLAWCCATAFPANTPVAWSLPGAGEISLSKTLAVWLLPLAGLALYALSLAVKLAPVPVTNPARRARVITVGENLTLWALLAVYTVASLSAISVAMPVGFQVALGVGLLLFLASALPD